MGGRSTPLHPVVLFLLVAAPFLVRPELVGGDEPHYAAMASSIAFDGDFDLRDEYAAVAAGTSAAAGPRSPARDAILALAALGAGIEAGAIASPFRSFWSLPVDQIVARSASAALVTLAAAAIFFGVARRLANRSAPAG